jgi:MYXO-CTERM domain-containing protein
MRTAITAIAAAALLTCGGAAAASAQTPGSGTAPTPAPTTVVQTQRDDSGKWGLLGLLGLTGLLGLRRRKPEHVETTRPVSRPVETRGGPSATRN